MRKNKKFSRGNTIFGLFSRENYTIKTYLIMRQRDTGQ